MGDKKQVIYGKNPVLEALKQNPNNISKVWIDKNTKTNPQIKNILSLIKKHNIPLTTTTKKQLEKLSNTIAHQGIVAITSPKQQLTLNDFLTKLTKNIPDKLLFVISDHIQDPRNLGAIARSAVAFGATALFLPTKRGSPITDVVYKTSAGLIEKLDIVKITNITETIKRLQNELNLWVIGLDMSGKYYINSFEFPQKTVIVAGAEGKGLSKRVKQQCDFLVKIPMIKGIDSLNVSVATSIAMYEWYKNNLIKNGG